jgi:hypothetical protein
MSASTWYELGVRVALRKLFELGRADLFGSYPDELPPPHGYDSWVAYQTAKGLSTVTDFLPLGEPAEGCRLNMVWTRAGEDVATCGMHFVHANPDVLGDTLAITDAELAAIEARATTLWGSINGLFPASIVLDRYEWHNFGVGIRRPNPKRRETIGLSGAGTVDAANALPPQVATTVTFRTNHRKTWGRVYLPALAVASCLNGRLLAGSQASIRTAFGTFAEGVAGDSTPLVIWSPRRAGDALEYGPDAHAAHLDEPDTTSFAKSVTIVAVDDLFDVMRSRRFDKPTTIATHTLGA